MCGLFGVLFHKSLERPDHGRLRASVGLLQHRGPDDQSVFVGEGIGLAHSRLALLDLSSRSNQPFWDRDGRYALIYNGEIYNFRELRTELDALGIAFRTSSDTEVLLASLIHHGIDATLPKLEGMFAFALYDMRNRSLQLVRDRFGIKPLHMSATEERFVFASEIAALRPWMRFQPDVLSISSYLQGFGGPTQGHTFYENIHTVPPGTVLTVSHSGGVTSRRFWRRSDFWDPSEADRLRRLTPGQAVDAVDEAMQASVRSQLVADVPVGTLCSGGVDSSLITALAARTHTDLALFHANVAGPHSEYAAAAQLAKHLRLDLHTVTVTDQDSLDLLPDVLLHHGHPFTYHANSVPFLMVSRLVHSHQVKAVLSGEGADECFAGYPWMIFDVRSAARRSLMELPRRLARRVLGRATAPVGADDAAIVRGLHNRFEIHLGKARIREELQRRSGRAPTGRQLVTLDQLGYHLRTLLQRNDALGMAASVEARFPFLDSRVVTLAVNLPYALKARIAATISDPTHWFLRDKWVLRQVAARYLPPALARRRKWGFATVAPSRMQINPRLFVDSFVADLFGLRDPGIADLLTTGSQELRLRLLHLEVWAQVCLHGAPLEEVRSRLLEHVSMATAPHPIGSRA